MKLRLPAVVAGLAACFGCAAPHVNLPANSPAPHTWRTPPDRVRSADSSTEPFEWWRPIADPELDRLVALALAQNLDIQIAARRVQHARAVLAGAVAERRPTLGSSLELRQERVPETRIRDTDGSGARIPPYRRNLISDQIVAATYEVDLLGRLALAVQASNAAALATEAEQRAVRQWVVHDVVVAYADTRVADALLSQARRALAFATERLAAERIRREAGLSTPAAERALEDELAGAREALADLERRRRLGLARLALMIGKAPADLEWFAAEEYFDRFSLTGAIEADLPASVLERRPDIDAAWHRVIAATTEAERARLEKYPRITLTGGAGFLSETLRRWLAGDALGWVIGAVVQMPLIDTGRIQARTDAALAVAAEQQMEYRRAVLQALHEVEAALAEAVYARERLRSAAAALHRRAADRTAANDRLRRGAGDRSALLTAELAQIEARQTMMMRRHDLILAWASLQKTLGR